MPEPTQRTWRGATRSSRMFLALMAMVGTWLISCATLLLLRLSFEPGLAVGGLALISAPVAGYSYVFFVIPVTALFSRRLQLRFAYVLVALSLVWSTLVLRTLFREWPWTILREPLVGFFLPCWFGGFTLCAVGIYLCLLWRGSRMDESQRVFARGSSS